MRTADDDFIGIEKIQWQRSERNTRGETIGQSDRTGDSVVRDASYSDVIQASLREWSQGESESSTIAGAAGIGGVVGEGVIAGAGVVAAASTSSSEQSGTRGTTAQEEMRWRDAVRRYGEAVRKFQSMVVEEVTQTEEVTGTAEVVRNINYGHTLTVTYYQILRHLAVETNFAGVRECLFVPFAMKPFSLLRAYRWREALSRGLRDRYVVQTHYQRVLDGYEN